MTTPPSLFGLLLGAGATLALVVVLAWLASRWWYGRQIGELKSRARKHEQVHSTLLEKQSGLLAQLDTLRSELRAQKALTASLSTRPGEPAKPATPPAVAEALSEPFITSRNPRKPLDFEDTQIL